MGINTRALDLLPEQATGINRPCPTSMFLYIFIDMFFLLCTAGTAQVRRQTGCHFQLRPCPSLMLLPSYGDVENHHLNEPKTTIAVSNRRYTNGTKRASSRRTRKRSEVGRRTDATFGVLHGTVAENGWTLTAGFGGPMTTGSPWDVRRKQIPKMQAAGLVETTRPGGAVLPTPSWLG